jgi:multicomponent Na+:H+ antiporter subunit G
VTLLRDVLCVVLVSAGALFFLAGTAGLLRFRDALSRLHALSKADVTGLGLVVLGLLLQADSFAAAFRLVLIWALALLAGATGSQLVGHRETRAPVRGPGPESEP